MPLDDLNWRDIVNDDGLLKTPLEIANWVGENSLSLDSLTVVAIDKQGNSKLIFHTENFQHTLQTIALMEAAKLQMLKGSGI